MPKTSRSSSRERGLRTAISASVRFERDDIRRHAALRERPAHVAAEPIEASARRPGRARRPHSSRPPAGARAWLDPLAAALRREDDTIGALAAHGGVPLSREMRDRVIGGREVDPPGSQQRSQEVRHPGLFAIAQQTKRRQAVEAEARGPLVVDPAEHVGHRAHAGSPAGSGDGGQSHAHHSSHSSPRRWRVPASAPIIASIVAVAITRRGSLASSPK